MFKFKLLLLLGFSFLLSCKSQIISNENIISKDTLSICISQKDSIEQKELIHYIIVTIQNKTEAKFYLDDMFSFLGCLVNEKRESIMDNLSECEVGALTIHCKNNLQSIDFLDSLHRSLLLDSLKKCLVSIPNTVRLKETFFSCFEGYERNLYFINPKSIYQIYIPYVTEKRKIKVHFEYTNYFNIPPNDSYYEEYIEVYKKYVKMPINLNGYIKLNRSLISDTIEIK
jgi:hypothetical protein